MIRRAYLKGQAREKIAGVAVSHPDREIFPSAHITKGDLARFYEAMGELIMPGLVDRPVSVVRCPGGIDKECFFQRSKGKGMPEHIHTLDITYQGKSHNCLYLKNLTGLVELVQMGGIEMHPWGVKRDNPEKPDRLVFDFDPAEDVPFEAVKLAAAHLRGKLEDIGLRSFLKTTGGKGLHVTIPILRLYTWDEIKVFTRNFSQQMVTEVPDAYTIHMARKKRGGKIFIDYLRNDFASTAVMDYCVRARTDAGVAMPLEWKELGGLESASQFSMEDALKRRKKGLALLRDYRSVRQGIAAKIMDRFR